MVSGEGEKRFEKYRLRQQTCGSRTEPDTSWIWNRFVYYLCTSSIFDRPNRFRYFCQNSIYTKSEFCILSNEMLFSLHLPVRAHIPSAPHYQIQQDAMSINNWFLRLSFPK